MANLNHEQIVVMFLALGMLLGVARLLGELAQKFHQPSVLGELLAGVLLGPTVLGTIAPDVSKFLFPREGPNSIALHSITTLSVVLFLLVAGMEVDLSIIRRQGRVAPKVSLTGIAIPFLLGLIVAWTVPQAMGRHVDADPTTFALFFATAMSISALPVIAKTLMDLGLYRSDLGMIVVSAAVVDDLIGWLIFAVVLGMMGGETGHESHIGVTIVLTLAFACLMLTAGRWAIHRTLPVLQKYSTWPGGVLGFAFTLALLAAAFTEWIGIHAIFGSFLVGVAIGDSSHLREHTRVTIHHFISFIFAPVFFASIGLKVNFLTHFDLVLILTVFGIACLCKLTGGILGAYWGGMPRREAWAVGFAMNSRGAMEIILGILALEAGIIRDRLFVALVVMAIVTSMMSGPLMRWVLRVKKKSQLLGAMSPELFLRELEVESRREAIHQITLAACKNAGLKADEVESAAWAREEALGTGIGHGVAIPHARVKGLPKSLVAVGISDTGIDFDAPDGNLAHVIFLLLTPYDDSTEQLELTAEIALLFRDPHFVEKVLRTKSYAEFVSLLAKAHRKAETPASGFVP